VTKYKFKRPSIHLRKRKTTKDINGNENENDLFDFPF
jgi:hypothetical protein